MSLLPFKSLPRYRPRRFVPETIDLGDWKQIEPLFDELEKRASACRSAEDLEHWLLDDGELSAALDEESSRRYIAMTCHTHDAGSEKAYLHFVEEIEPRLKPRQFQLSQCYLNHPLRQQLPKRRYEVYNRNTALHVELYRPDNVPLETEESRLGQQYQKLSGSLTVQFRGGEETLVQMGRYLEETDRATRREAWEKMAARRLLEADRFDGLFDQLLKLRERIAAHAGFPDYLHFAFRARARFDYTPEDCRQFHEAIEQEIMPLVRDLHEHRRRLLALDRLRPWDLAVDPQNRQPLRPFEQVDQLVTGSQEIFNRLDPDLARGFNTLRELRLLDLDNRKGKAPGGYQSTLSESRLPFIFMNAVGQQRDLETMLHEAGHAFHALATQSEDLHAYRGGPIEFCEVASMSMELLGNEFIETFYPAPEAVRARRDHLEGIIKIFPWIATVDAFQHWIYTHPGHSRADREQAWLDLMDRFGGDIDWSGHERTRASLWHRQLHIFLHPFYYIEYGIAQLGALQVWTNSRKDRPDALRRYKSALALGGSRPLPELFEAAGCRLDFSRESVRPLVAMLREEMQRLDNMESDPTPTLAT
jgi:oligoendopeptidase F